MRPTSPTQNTIVARDFWFDILFLTLVIGSLFFLFLGSRPLFVPDEGRYAEIAREMLQNKDYITPTLNSVIYFEKPALFYWLTALSFKVGGVGIWSARAVNAILGLFGSLATYYTARILYNRMIGILAALIQSTCLLYFIMAHMVSLDMPVTVFLSLTLYSFLLGTRTEHPKKYYYLYLAAIFAALAVLTKGLIGIVFPFLIITPYALLTKEYRNIKFWRIPTALILFLLVACPWHLLVQLKHPAFFHFYFIEQHFLRYTDLSIGHYEPLWFFIPYLLLGLLPWVIFLPQTLSHTIQSIKSQQDKTSYFFLIWVIVVFLFFSFSKSKLIPYILPLFPAMALLIARYIANRFYKDKLDNKNAILLLTQSTFISAVIVTTWMTLVTFIAFAHKLDTRTIQPLAITLNPILKSTDIVVTYNQYYQDLPFYLQRRVSILNWRNELSFGMQQQNTHDFMINDVKLWQLWRGNQRVFIIISFPEWESLQQKKLPYAFHVIGKTKTNLLISNQSNQIKN